MPNVLIVGASGGIGKALHQLYGQAGWQVMKLNRAECDLSHPKHIQDVLPRKFSSVRFDLCILSAGTSDAGFVDHLTSEDYRQCLEVNFLAPVQIFRTLYDKPYHCRRFVFLLSGAAQLMVPGLSAYGISKRALRDYLNAIDLDGSFPDCYILKVWPGSVQTDFNQKTRIHGAFKLPVTPHSRNPKEVAQRIFEAVKKGHRSLCLSALPHFLGYLQNLWPCGVRFLIRISGKFKRPHAT